MISAQALSSLLFTLEPQSPLIGTPRPGSQPVRPWKPPVPPFAREAGFGAIIAHEG